MVRMVGSKNILYDCRLWGVMLKYYKKQTSTNVLHSSYHYVINHPQKVLMYIILIEGIVTGIAIYKRAIIQYSLITGMNKVRLN